METARTETVHTRTAHTEMAYLEAERKEAQRAGAADGDGRTSAQERITFSYALGLAAPHTWPASLFPALLGILLCGLEGMPLKPWEAAALLAACVLMQSGVNTLNDLFDQIKGTDRAEDQLEDGDAVLVHHQIPVWQVLALFFGMMGTAGLVGLWMVIKAGPAPLLAGLIGAAAVGLYSAGPLPLSYLPVGELVSGYVMGGLIPVGILACATGELRFGIFPRTLPLILGIGLIMLTNNLCDIEKDRRAGRHTLPALLGRERARVLYHFVTALWLLSACLLPVLYYGQVGLCAPLLLCAAGRKVFRELFTYPFTQTLRIRQMQSVLKANILADGSYVLAAAAALAVRGGMY